VRHADLTALPVCELYEAKAEGEQGTRICGIELVPAAASQPTTCPYKAMQAGHLESTLAELQRDAVREVLGLHNGLPPSHARGGGQHTSGVR
jgi:hypothetical protein